MTEQELIADPELGEFRQDVEAESFRGKAEWFGNSVDLTLGYLGEGGIGASLAIAREIYRNGKEWDARVMAAATDNLLINKNENWLEEGEEPLTRDEFASRMSLESIDVQPDGYFTFMFADGDMFWGHWIEVSGSVADGPTYVNILG